MLKDFPEVGYLEVVGDARLDQGGCILETEIGIIDASLDSQLAALQAALTESVARSGEEEGTPVEEPGAAPARALAPGRGLRRCRSPAAATLAVRSAPSEQGEAAAFGLRRIQADEDLELARLGRVPELAVVELQVCLAEAEDDLRDSPGSSITLRNPRSSFTGRLRLATGSCR